MFRKFFNYNWKLVAIIGVAIFSFVIFGLGTAPLNNDSGQFISIADNLLSSGRFSSDGQNLTSIREPGYPLFLAVIFNIFGEHNYSAVRVVQFLLFLSLIVYFYFFVIRIFPKNNFPLLAVFLAAFFPSFNFYNGQILSESLFAFFLGCSLIFFLAASRDNFLNKEKIFFLGLFLGILSLVRMEGVIVFLVIFSSLLFLKHFKQALVVLCIFVALVCPWMFRNYHNFGSFSLTNGRQELQYFAVATLISRANLTDFPLVSLARIKKGLRLKMSERDIQLEFDYNENNIMWRTGDFKDFLVTHPELSPRDVSLIKINPMEAYSRDGERSKELRNYCKRIIINHPVVAATDMIFNTIGTMGPELPTVVKENVFFKNSLIKRFFYIFYFVFYLLVYIGMFLFFVKSFPLREKKLSLYVLMLVAIGVLAGHSIFSFTTRFNTPLFMVYFIILSFYFSLKKPKFKDEF